MGYKVGADARFLILLARVQAELGRLALDGEAKMAIVTSEAASPLVKAAAADLQRLLREITGANSAVETGTGQRGIVLGRRWISLRSR